MELRHWKDDSEPYSLPVPSVRDKLPTGLTVVSGDVPKSPLHCTGQGCCRRRARSLGRLPSLLALHPYSSFSSSPVCVPLSKRPAISFLNDRQATERVMPAILNS